MTDAEQAVLQAEVEYWRRDAVARAWGAAAQVKAAYEKDDTERAAMIKVGQLDPALYAIRDAEAQEWHTCCEACGNPLLTGQLVHLYDDVGDVHVDCDNPDSAQPDERSSAYDDGFSPDQMAKMLAFARGVAGNEE